MKSKFDRQLQAFLDTLVPYAVVRWIVFLSLLTVIYIRIIYVQGFFIVGYALGIYLLSQFIAFLSPKFNPEMQAYDSGTGPQLPQSTDDEFRPFIRRLPEFLFWKKGMRAALIGLFS